MGQALHQRHFLLTFFSARLHIIHLTSPGQGAGKTAPFCIDLIKVHMYLTRWRSIGVGEGKCTQTKNWISKRRATTLTITDEDSFRVKVHTMKHRTTVSSLLHE